MLRFIFFKQWQKHYILRIVNQLDALSLQVSSLDCKIDRILYLLEDKKNDKSLGISDGYSDFSDSG